MPTSAAIYCRISKDRTGAGLGIERQEADCRELANQLGWTVTAVHADNDLSAYSGKPRPGYRALLAKLEAGQADAVLAWHTDRLHRSPVELETYIEVCERRGVPTHCVKAGALDLSTASGRMTARIHGAVARQEVEHMIERQKAAKMQAARAGRFRGGRRAFGYESDGVTVRGDEAAHLLDATQRVMWGESLGSIAQAWNAHGVTGTRGAQWTSAAVHALLVRPRNAGIVAHEGEEIATAEWPAVVPEDQWRAVCQLLTAPGRQRPPSNTARWLGSSLYVCGVCGATMRTATSGGTGSHAKRPVYRCRMGAHLGRVAETVDAMVTDLVLRRLSRPGARLLLVPPSSEVDTAALSAESEALRIRNTGLVSMFTDGVITRGELEVERSRIELKLAEVAAQMASAAAGSPLAGFADAGDVHAAWGAASVARRKAIVDTLMVVTLLPASRGRRPGGHYFDPDSVRIEWRQVAP